MSAQAPPGRRVAVAVLSFDRRADALACLASLRGQTGPGDAVVLVDNGSSDGTADAVAREHPGVEVVRNPSNLGCAGGLNTCLRWGLDRGFRWILLLSDDTAARPGAVEALVALGESRPDAGAVQALLLRRADPGLVDARWLRPFRFTGADDEGEGIPASGAPREPRPVFGAALCAVLLRADAVRAAGLLDEEIHVLGEDVDHAFRLRMAGYEALYCPAAEVLHGRGISGPPRDRAAARRRKFFLQRGAVALALRYWPAGWLLLSLPVLAWRSLQALALSRSHPGHPCLPLWRRFLAERGPARRAMRERDVDRWFR